MASFNTTDVTISDATIGVSVPKLTANETVSIDNGVTVTVSTGQWTELGAGNVSVIYGTLRLINTSTTNGWVFYLKSQSNNITGSGRSVFDIQGNWIEIGTGTGAAGQWVRHWDTTGDYCGAIWVETAAGSGVYEKYMNLNGASASHLTYGVFSNWGAGSYGKVFSQGIGSVSTTAGTAAVVGTGTQFTKLTVGHKIAINAIQYTIASITDDLNLTLTSNVAASYTNTYYISDVIWFGDGTNGSAPALGAKIRVPNIILSFLGNPNATDAYIGCPNFDVKFDTVQVSRVRVHTAGSPNRTLSAKRTSFCDTFTTANGFISAYFEDCSFTAQAADSSALFQTGSSGGPIGSLKFINCCGWSSGNPLNFDTTAPYFENCEFSHIVAATSSANLLNIVGNTRCTIRGGRWVGQITCAGFIDIEGSEHLETNTLVDRTTSARSAIVFGATGTVQGARIVNVRTPTSGAFYDAFIKAAGTTDGLELRGVRINSTGSRYTYLINFAYYARNVVIGDCYVASSRSTASSIITFGNGMGDFAIRNVRVGWSSSAAVAGTLCERGTIRGLPGASSSAKSDIYFAELYTGPNTGAIFMTTPMSSEASAAYVTYVGSAVIGASAQLYLPKTGDSVTYETDHKILGVTGFQNVDPTYGGNGLGAGYWTKEYAIDTGSGYGPWKALSGANLSLETVDKNAGFLLKIRITNNAANNSNYTGTSVSIATTVDQTVMYPSASGRISLTGLKPGSEVRVYNRADNSQICGVEDSQDSFTYDYDYYNDIQVDIVIHHINYQYIRYENLTLGIDGLSIPVQQQRDRNYLNP